MIISVSRCHVLNSCTQYPILSTKQSHPVLTYSYTFIFERKKIAAMAYAPGVQRPTEIVQGRVCQYDNRYLVQEIWTNALNGLAAPFKLEFCKDMRQDRYYSFRILASQDVSTTIDEQTNAGTGFGVRIGDQYSDYIHPHCSCYGDKDAAIMFPCKHIFWLFNQLFDYTDELRYSTTQTLSLRANGSALENNTPFEEIEAVGLDHIAAQRQWRIETSDETYSENISVEDRRRAFNFERWPLQEQVQDLLAYYSESEGVLNLEALSQSSTLSGTIFRIVLRNPELFADLREEATLEGCTIAYFNRIDREVTIILRRFVTYVTRGLPNGPSADPVLLDDENGAPTVSWCAGALLRRVQIIDLEVRRRGDIGPMARDRAFELLLRIIFEVVDLNIDISTIKYGSPQPSIPTRLPEDNLFAMLIGPFSAINDSNDAPGQHVNFGLSTMWQLVAVGGRFYNRLNELSIAIALEETCVGYRDDLLSLMNSIKTYPVQRRRLVDVRAPTV